MKPDRNAQSKELPNRRSIRLKGYDYSRNGFYFITITTNKMRHLFGEIKNAKLISFPHEPDKMIEKLLLKIEEKFENTKIEPYIIMPNHIHFILQIENFPAFDKTKLGEMIGWFKTMTTNEYINCVKSGLFKPFYKRLWLRNYYEHIIRDVDEHSRIWDYIENNPQKWEEKSRKKKHAFSS